MPAVVLIPPKVPLPALSSFPVFSLSFCCRHTAAAALNWKGGICLHDVIVRAANGKEEGLFCIKPADWWESARRAAASVLHERAALWPVWLWAERRGVSFVLKGQIGAACFSLHKHERLDVGGL